MTQVAVQPARGGISRLEVSARQVKSLHAAGSSGGGTTPLKLMPPLPTRRTLCEDGATT